MSKRYYFRIKKTFSKSWRPKDSEYVFRFILGVVGQILELSVLKVLPSNDVIKRAMTSQMDSKDPLQLNPYSYKIL